MANQNWKILTTSVILSALTSIAVSVALKPKIESSQRDILRVKGIELVDDRGRVLGAFELTAGGRGNAAPRLVLRDIDGRDSIRMEVDSRGDGTLGFSSDHWNEGAVILGHLQNVDDGSEPKSKQAEDKMGAWGLRIRSEDNKFTGLGFLNSGEPITPMTNKQNIH
jgi:hypothetical protein